MIKRNNFIQRVWVLIMMPQFFLNSSRLLLLLPWLVAYGGCMFGKNKESVLKSGAKLLPKGDYQANLAPSAPPFPEKSPPVMMAPEILPPSYDEVMAADNKGTMSSKEVDKSISKQEAKKNAEVCHEKAKNVLTRCLKHEINIRDKKDAEKWWKEFSTGWFMKRWIGNSMLKRKRVKKSAQAGLLSYTLRKTEEYLNEMEKYTDMAIQKGSKGKGLLLIEKRRKLRGQVLNIRNAMAEHITEIGVGHKVDPQIQDTPGIFPSPFR